MLYPKIFPPFYLRHSLRVSNCSRLPRLLRLQDKSTDFLFHQGFRVASVSKENHISPIHWFCTRVLTFEYVTPVVIKSHEALSYFHLFSRVFPSWNYGFYGWQWLSFWLKLGSASSLLTLVYGTKWIQFLIRGKRICLVFRTRISLSFKFIFILKDILTDWAMD